MLASPGAPASYMVLSRVSDGRSGSMPRADRVDAVLSVGVCCIWKLRDKNIQLMRVKEATRVCACAGLYVAVSSAPTSQQSA